MLLGAAACRAESSTDQSSVGGCVLHAVSAFTMAQALHASTAVYNALSNEPISLEFIVFDWLFFLYNAGTLLVNWRVHLSALLGASADPWAGTMLWLLSVPYFYAAASRVRQWARFQGVHRSIRDSYGWAAGGCIP